MTVSSEVARVVHTANGTAAFFSYAPMDGVTSANLKVYLFDPTTGALTLQTLGTDYTFGSGGVTFTAAPPSGRRVILLRQVELLQPDIYKTNAPFPAAVTERRLDEIVKGLQQINDVVQNRSIILPPGDAGFSSNVLPAAENRKGGVLYFNATTGDPEAKQLADTIVAVSPWAMSFLTQSSVEEGLDNIGVVYKAGDTMTGPLTLPGAPTATNHAATKGYVDTEVGTRVAKAGDTMTGPLTLPGAPTAANHAATKAYVDTEVDARVAKSGDTMTGFLTLHADPTAAMHAVTKAYADRSGPGGSTGLIATTSGTTYDVTGIPDWANVVEVLFLNVTVSSSNHVFLNTRLGTSNGFATAGYTSATGLRNNEITSTTQFVTSYVRNDPTNVIVRIVRAHNNIWMQAHVGSIGGGFLAGGGGNINLNGALTQIRVFIETSTFTGGHFVVRWTA
jgi:hypothetical protein